MRFLTLTLLVIMAACLSMSLSAKELPPATVCPQMEEAGDRLLAGQPDDFYFIETAGTQFPVPSFFLVASPGLSGDNEIKLESRPSIASSRPARIRQSKNLCDWSLVAHVGPLDRMYELAGGKEKFNQTVEQLYQVGQIQVALRAAPAGMTIHRVAAWHDDGFIMFFTDKPERAFWLIRLAAELNDSK